MVSQFEHVQHECLYASKSKKNQSLEEKKYILENQSHTARNIALYIDNEACNDGNESLN